MYQQALDKPPLFPIPLENKNQQKEAAPPKSALPLISPLTERAKGDLQPKPYRILKNIVSIDSCIHRNAAIDQNNVLWTWGAISCGKIPNGSYSYDAPQEVCYTPQVAMKDVLSASVGAWHYMCITKDLKLWGWGENINGELGLGDYEDRKEPTFIMDDARSVFLGDGSTYIVKTDNSLWHCGYTGNELSNEDTKRICTPACILSDVESVSVSDDTVMVIKTGGGLWGWGGNSSKVLFTHDNQHYIDAPVHLMNDVKNVSIMTGIGSFAMIVTHNGDLLSVGLSVPGSLVSYPFRQRDKNPVKIMENVTDVSTGTLFSLALLSDGRLYAFGENSVGQCGNGKSTYSLRKPQLIFENVKEAKAGHYHGMALQTNGDVWIWGGDYGISMHANTPGH